MPQQLSLNYDHLDEYSKYFECHKVTYRSCGNPKEEGYIVILWGEVKQKDLNEAKNTLKEYLRKAGFNKIELVDYKNIPRAEDGNGAGDYPPVFQIAWWDEAKTWYEDETHITPEGVMF